jgi:hypothetical protein
MFELNYLVLQLGLMAKTESSALWQPRRAWCGPTQQISSPKTLTKLTAH